MRNDQKLFWGMEDYKVKKNAQKMIGNGLSTSTSNVQAICCGFVTLTNRYYANANHPNKSFGPQLTTTTRRFHSSVLLVDITTRSTTKDPHRGRSASQGNYFVKGTGTSDTNSFQETFRTESMLCKAKIQIGSAKSQVLTIRADRFPTNQVCMKRMACRGGETQKENIIFNDFIRIWKKRLEQINHFNSP